MLFLFSSPGSGSIAKLQVLHPGVAGIEQHRFGLRGAVALQNDVARRQNLSAPSRTTRCAFSPFESLLMESDLRLQARFCERARRQLDVGDLDVVRHVLAAEADGVDGNPLALDFRDGFQIDAAGVVGAVAHQNHRADGQRGRIRQHFLQAVADVRGGRRGVQLVQVFDAFQMIAQPVKSNLKFAL